MLYRLKFHLNRLYYFLPLEALFWIAALVALALYIPSGTSHMSLCPLSHLGFKYCPGCGLGRSISFLLHGSIKESLAMHPLGIPAFLIISWRIITLLYNFFNNIKLHNKWQTY